MFGDILVILDLTPNTSVVLCSLHNAGREMDCYGLLQTESGPPACLCVYQTIHN
jgi:hypothetical protein